VKGVQVGGIGVTGQRQGLAMLDTRGRELYLGPNLDLRAVMEGAALDEAHQAELYRATGHLPSLLFAPAKLRWFQAHRPQTYQEIATVFTLADWVAFRLTDERAAEAALAGEIGLLEVQTRGWAVGSLQQLGLRTDWLPPLVQAGSRVGTLGPSSAAELGLPAGIPVCVAGPDTQCGLLSLGLTETGQAGIVGGWSLTVQRITSRPFLDRQRRTWCGCWLWPGRWVLEVNAGDVGNTYGWLKELLFPSGSSFDGAEEGYELMEALAQEVPAGSEGVLSFLSPGPLDLSQAGLRTGGLLAPVPFTFSQVGRGHLARSALEGMAFTVKAACLQLEKLSRSSLSSLAFGGGMAQSRLFPQLLANVIGKEIALASSPHISALGAALAAATMVGHYSSLAEAGRAAGARLRRLSPDPLAALEYQGIYQRWQEALVKLRRIGIG
jgi:autoinducer 2 (AI-2) kinase